jgi:hypothetical protein
MNIKDKPQDRIIPEQERRRTIMKTTLAKLGLLAGGLVFAGGTNEEGPPSLAQVVALDECDPGHFQCCAWG